MNLRTIIEEAISVSHLEAYYQNIREQRKEVGIGKSRVGRICRGNLQPATTPERGENADAKPKNKKAILKTFLLVLEVNK